VALLFCNVAGLTELKVWLARPVQLLTDLGSFGYPHAVTSNAAGDRIAVSVSRSRIGAIAGGKKGAGIGAAAGGVGGLIYDLMTREKKK
jgi:hypothetical protein